MKRKITTTFLLVVFLSAHCFAQTERTGNEPTDPQEEIKHLNKSLSDLEKELSKKDKEIERLTEQLKKAKENNETLLDELTHEKEEGKSATNRAQIKHLKDSIKNITQSHEGLLRQMKADSVKLAEVYATQMNDWCVQHQKDSVELSRLTEELAQLGEFKVKWLSQLADGVDEKWLSKRYSEFALADLELDYKQYEQYALSDKKVADARDKLKQLLDEKRVYDMGIRLISTKYDASDIEDCLTRVKALMATVNDAQKKDELNVLRKKLKDYGVTIEIFQEVIDAVEQQIQNQESHSAAWPLAKSVIEKQEKNYEYISAIKDIPWLAEQWEEYYKCLENNCLEANSVRNLIKSLVP